MRDVYCGDTSIWLRSSCVNGSIFTTGMARWESSCLLFPTLVRRCYARVVSSLLEALSEVVSVSVSIWPIYFSSNLWQARGFVIAPFEPLSKTKMCAGMPDSPAIYRSSLRNFTLWWSVLSISQLAIEATYGEHPKRNGWQKINA